MHLLLVAITGLMSSSEISDSVLARNESLSKISTRPFQSIPASPRKPLNIGAILRDASMSFSLFMIDRDNCATDVLENFRINTTKPAGYNVAKVMVSL